MEIMPRTVLENLLVMAPQATAIGILLLLGLLGLFLGACAFLLATGWRIDKRNNAPEYVDQDTGEIT